MSSAVRRWWPLTLRGTGALLLAVAAFVIAERAGIPEVLYFATLLSALLVASAIALLLTRGAGTVTRAVSPDVPEVGAPASVLVRAGLRSALPTGPGRWIDALPPGLAGRAEGSSPALGPTLSAGGATVQVRYDVVGATRGIHSLGPLEVTVTDPFGLLRRRLALGRTTPVTVAPAIVDLAVLPPAAGEAGGSRQTTTLQLGQGADNLVARPYAPGDSMRRIHWRATAHRDTLMVRQEEQEASPAATVVLDRALSRWTPLAAHAPGSDPGFETAVTACVSAVARLVHEGYTVDVVDSDGTLLIDTVEGGDDGEARAAAAEFATLRGRADDSARRVVPASAAALAGPVVVITGALETDDRIALGGVAHHSALPVLLVVSEDADLSALRTGGWRVAVLRPGGDIAAAWDDAMQEGYARDGH
ncbi:MULTISPECIES: DUF58 domain-containing protein [Microbacterium]|uniref:DUF58 domain-containing protein n=1 Tax=Microbacterium TaxID=33882 RepID=UPI00277EAA1B|nr:MULTISPECIES: DUF58 domain-containing protein [Microbacterium]MDQ1084786.1 uncharacterized protein (DUF58 family) [Microbacterium sp. SORGH_AS_0344]MDQ1169935.1 uncharacterized protein (DUF58 family) [Microbacterium proteolyticum]